MVDIVNGFMESQRSINMYRPEREGFYPGFFDLVGQDGMGRE